MLCAQCWVRAFCRSNKQCAHRSGWSQVKLLACFGVTGLTCSRVCAWVCAFCCRDNQQKLVLIWQTFSVCLLWLTLLSIAKVCGKSCMEKDLLRCTDKIINWAWSLHCWNFKCFFFAVENWISVKLKKSDMIAENFFLEIFVFWKQK